MFQITVTPRQWVGKPDARRAEYTFTGDRRAVDNHADHMTRHGAAVRWTGNGDPWTPID